VETPPLPTIKVTPLKLPLTVRCAALTGAATVSPLAPIVAPVALIPLLAVNEAAEMVPDAVSAVALSGWLDVIPEAVSTPLILALLLVS
jgi:hypothetical protein